MDHFEESMEENRRRSQAMTEAMRHGPLRLVKSDTVVPLERSVRRHPSNGPSSEPPPIVA